MPKYKHLIPPVAVAALLIAVAAADEKKPDASKLPPAAAGKIDFDADIKPILAAHCVKCHTVQRGQELPTLPVVPERLIRARDHRRRPRCAVRSEAVEHESVISFLIGVGVACAGLVSVLVSRRRSGRRPG